jgi:hypothetical protein
MNEEQALQFLREHQPMPPDEEWTDELADRYDEIRKFFINHPNPACIPLFLNSHGEIHGRGVYQLVDSVFYAYSPDEVIPHLIDALGSPHKSVRYWVAQICLSFPDKRLLKPILETLEISDEDTRYFCYCMLGRILEVTDYKSKEINSVLENGLIKETDDDILELLDEIKDEIKKNSHY